MLSAILSLAGNRTKQVRTHRREEACGSIESHSQTELARMKDREKRGNTALYVL